MWKFYILEYFCFWNLSVAWLLSTSDSVVVIFESGVGICYSDHALQHAALHMPVSHFSTSFLELQLLSESNPMTGLGIGHQRYVSQQTALRPHA